METADTFPAKRSSVMWADDDSDLLWLMKRALNRDGINVKTFDHAPTCGEIVKEHPSVLFLDVDLGDANGAEVCERLKKDRLGASIPVVLVSAQPRDKLRDTALACRADGYITKPFLPEHIVQLAKQYAQL